MVPKSQKCVSFNLAKVSKIGEDSNKNREDFNLNEAHPKVHLVHVKRNIKCPPRSGKVVSLGIIELLSMDGILQLTQNSQSIASPTLRSLVAHHDALRDDFEVHPKSWT